MLQVTEYVEEPHMLNYAIQQIEKYDKDVTTIRKTKHGFAVWRKDMKKMKHSERFQAICRESPGAGSADYRTRRIKL